MSLGCCMFPDTWKSSRWFLMCLIWNNPPNILSEKSKVQNRCVICYHLFLRKKVGTKTYMYFYNIFLEDTDDMADSEEGKLELNT